MVVYHYISLLQLQFYMVFDIISPRLWNESKVLLSRIFFPETPAGPSFSSRRACLAYASIALSWQVVGHMKRINSNDLYFWINE